MGGVQKEQPGDKRRGLEVMACDNYTKEQETLNLTWHMTVGVGW